MSRVPYAFGRVDKPHGGHAVRYYMPYGFGLENDGTPDAEAKVRLDKTMLIANKKNGSIFLGAGMQGYAQTKGGESLSSAAYCYLQTKGWQTIRIKMCAQGHNTVTETLTFRTFLCVDSCDDVVGEVVTSWWHVPRVWMICCLIFGKPIVVHAASSTHSGFLLIYDIAREVLAFPRSVLHASRAARSLRAFI